MKKILETKSVKTAPAGRHIALDFATEGYVKKPALIPSSMIHADTSAKCFTFQTMKRKAVQFYQYPKGKENWIIGATENSKHRQYNPLRTILLD